MTFDVETFKSAMAEFASGVTVVTTRHDGVPFGMTVSAFTSVSLAPPLVLVCIANDASPLGPMKEAGVFAVNVLSDQQVEHGERFAGMLDVVDRFDGVAVRDGLGGVPLLEGCVAHVECKVVASHVMGDHVVFLGEVVAAHVRGADAPLLHHRRVWAKIVPGTPVAS
ncbi:MAG: flavin reductase family protein [Polyangiaceae bacterium]